MAFSKRTQLYLTPEQWRSVEMEARRRGVSAAEVVRDAIERYCARKPDFGEAVKAVAGAWAGLTSVSDRFVEDMRVEWSRRGDA